MPNRPRDVWRPSDIIGQFARGPWLKFECEEDASSAIARGKLGGEARARRLSPEERQAIARKAASARWDKNRLDAAE